MQAAQQALTALAVVVLHEVVVGARGRVEGLLVKALVEETARVPKDLRLDDQDLGDGGGLDLHAVHQGNCIYH